MDTVVGHVATGRTQKAQCLNGDEEDVHEEGHSKRLQVLHIQVLWEHCWIDQRRIVADEG